MERIVDFFNGINRLSPTEFLWIVITVWAVILLFLIGRWAYKLISDLSNQLRYTRHYIRSILHSMGERMEKMTKKVMPRKHRHKYIDQTAAWLITDAFEEAIVRGELTAKEVNSLYRRIGHSCNLPDLIAPHLKERTPPEQLKAQIVERLSNGDHANVVKFPDSTGGKKAKNKVELELSRKYKSASSPN
jgi:hypothetical protein